MTFEKSGNVRALREPAGEAGSAAPAPADKTPPAKANGKGGKEKKANGARAPRAPRTGRTDRSGQEAIINQTLLMQKLPSLVKLITAAEEAKNDLSEAVKKVAEDTGYLAKVVLRRAKAEASDDYADKQKEVKQLALAFETDTPFLKG